MSDISIVFCTDDSVKDNIKNTIGMWSKKGLLKNFIYVESFENSQYRSSECINGTYVELEDLKTKLSNIELDFIRVVSLTTPEKDPVDIESFKKSSFQPNGLLTKTFNISFEFK